MSTLAQKRAAIEKVAMQIHSGSANDSAVENALKTFASAKVTSVAAPATTYPFTHSDQDEILRLSGLTGATAITLSAGSELELGATLVIEVTQGLTGRNVTVDCGTPTYTLTGVASDTDALTFRYVATGEWILISNYKSIDAA